MNIIGEQAERIYIAFSHDRLATMGLSPQDIFNALNGQNALAAAGEAGVAHLLRLFAEDMKVTMTLTGATSPSAISLDCLDRLEQDQHRTHAVPVSLPA